MQADMMKGLGTDCGCAPARGWIVRGQQFSVCTIANVFCFISNQAASLNAVMEVMRDKVPHQEGGLI